MFERLKSKLRKSPAPPAPAPDSESWPFDQPRNCASVTMRQILDRTEPILLVSHDEDDHGWQFIGSTDANTNDGRVVCLSTIADLDPTVLQVANLPPGWQATRSNAISPWKRRRNPPAEDPDKKSLSSSSFLCPVCKQEHKGLPDFGANKPDAWFGVPEKRRSKDIKLTEDICEIEGKHFFVRGVIQIPIIGYTDYFGFGVWVSHKEENFRKYLANFDTADIGPFFGWLRAYYALFACTRGEV